jgi:spore photoproduct lyase
MTGRGRGKYCYRGELREEGESFLLDQLRRNLSGKPVRYIV